MKTFARIFTTLLLALNVARGAETRPNIVIFLYFSDNGPNSMRWNGGMKGKKGSTDEGGVRSVCFLRWPAKLPAGHTSSSARAHCAKCCPAVLHRGRAAW